MADAVSDAAPWTIARLLAWTQAHLAHHRIESPRLCAELLLAHALGCPRIELYTRYETAPDAEARARFREAVQRAAAGAPIAYITGTKEFFALTFEVSPEVLIPRPETEILVERVIDLARRRSEDAAGPLQSILEIGVGSGCVAVALARRLPEVRVCASDLSAGAVEVAQRNAARHLAAGDLAAGRLELRVGDLFAPWADCRGGFDVIVSNPPYIGLDEAGGLPATVRDYEPAAALFAGPDGLAVLRRLADEAAAYLKPGGWLLVEVSYRQGPAVRSLLEGAGWAAIVSHRDGGGHERVLQARRPPGGS